MPNTQGISLYSAPQVADMDRHAQHQGIDGFELMQQAGEAAFVALLNQWSSVSKLVIYAGAGNNGGDGYVIAKLAKDHEIDAEVIALKAPSELQGSAYKAAQLAKSAGVMISMYSRQCVQFQAGCIIVDALLGTGLERDVEGAYRDAIDDINNSGIPVLSVDVPSGINGSTGAIMGTAVKAELTVTMIAYKRGLFTAKGAIYSGQVRLAPLSVPKNLGPHVAQQDYRVSLSSWRACASLKWFEKRELDSHKGDFGHVLVVGGDIGFAGAAILAAGSALRSGAGLVSVATRREHVNAVLSHYPEAMVLGVDSGQELGMLLSQADSVVVGPGLGQSAWGQSLLQACFATRQPIVLDADALNLIAQGFIQHNLNQRTSVMTPHPGEAARLLGCTVKDVQADRFKAAHELSIRYHSTTVLKGNGSLVCEGEQISVCADGNPGMASGGMGDVLSGISGSFLAQASHDLPEASQQLMTSAVCLHSAAADEAAKTGENALLASDLIKQLGNLLP
ncbi:bifunctional ADP-dependent NAD(P)H-hydrate dehydratase/NAD(P)H-hydrate epimerase [Bermanella marisrubri]|uniref:Bifunctional NAD(P)H-hydrate repair enzyme n=1 Tax=Bermanella marisrubri TaxID=207949 RepID=Q1N268_9GAMM|nr:bifunctional ADP-dependent NAD(P)H-hydrate dehydratase/NAD(P)H-hydrate epimerase [Bermanella marisrubri]EAT12296.1 hypothetical protein RED65_15693 [Bermanella marisrubri]QIZ85385.1 bifunctional ADP-dependent NAD(P)H-hydrate dehydratase/NAD(P)H-hydrate epimerase [Bermanella marisrubri]